MPCRVEMSESELRAEREAATNELIKSAVAPFKERNDVLTHENDQLRELVLKLATKEDMPASLWIKIQKDQVEHRKEDLRRLEKTFTIYLEEVATSLGIGKALQTNDFQEVAERLTKVMRADPEKPLEPQLGFDPDAY